MRCRKIINNNIVWFGSYGKNQDGTAIKADNFSTEQQNVADSLTQRLSVLKGELWYKVSYGIPLFEKIKSKAYIDSYVATVVKQHPEVVSIIKFSSELVNKHYIAEIEILSSYGSIKLNI